jgi:leader peptidase (prepilin peptidase)/N-methyltransferase
VHTALTVGLAVAGAFGGVVLDVVGARIPPRKLTATDDTLAVAGSAGDEPGVAPAAPAVSSALQAPAERAAAAPPGPPGPAERALAAVVLALALAAAAWRIGPVPALAPYCVLFAGLLAVSVADLRVGLIPRKLLYPSFALMVVGLLAASALGPDWHAMGTAVLGGAVVFAVFYALWFFVPRAMGFGDVRLAGVVSVGLAWLGFGTLYIGLLFGFVAGAVFGIATALVRRSGRRTTFPFGPALALGTVVGVLFGPAVVSAWLGTR